MSETRVAAAGIPSRRWVWIAVAGVVVAAVAFVLVWFQPQKLFLDDTVDDPFPVAAGEGAPSDESSGDAPSGSAPAPAVDPVALRTGEFRSLDHGTTGRATVYELADGSRVLRFEGFETDNGPDLRVYLSTADASSDEGAFDDDFVDIGGLRGNVGDQNYDLPPELDLDRYQSVVVWCRRFSAGFGVSPLA